MISKPCSRRSFIAWSTLSFSITPLLAQGRKSYTIGMIAKSQGNPVFEAAHVAALDAAKELGAKHGLTIKIDWRTPNEEDSQKQAEYIEQLLLTGVDGISVSCSDANKLTEAINKAVGQGVPVATFSSDAAGSRRLVAVGIDEEAAGEQLMHELAEVMGGKGVVGVIAGNQNAPNLQRRSAGVLKGAKKYPGIKILGVYYHKETPQDAVARMEQVMQANPELTGWALIGGWPLFTQNAFKWKPGTIKCASVDALPPMLDYIRSGHVQVLLHQDVYAWGYRTVEHLINKLHFKKNPAAALDYSPLIRVDKANVEEFSKNWDKWLPKN
jgi:ribose transport system substrate-binding protein